MDVDDPREVELKLELDASDAAALKQRGLKGLGAGQGVDFVFAIAVVLARRIDVVRAGVAKVADAVALLDAARDAAVLNNLELAKVDDVVFVQRFIIAPCELIPELEEATAGLQAQIAHTRRRGWWLNRT